MRTAVPLLLGIAFGACGGKPPPPPPAPKAEPPPKPTRVIVESDKDDNAQDGVKFVH